jgi:hypothetical protein
MAVTPSGAPSPTSSLVPIVTRTWREYGGLLLGSGQTLVIAASRRASECAGVQLLGASTDGTPLLHGLLQPTEARMLARALVEAAAAVDQAQRHPKFTRAEVQHG